MGHSPMQCSDDALPGSLVRDWERFFQEDIEPRGHDIYPKIFEHNVLFPLQRMRETEQMMRLARFINPQVVMEIGADKGGGFYHWVKCFVSVRKAIACEIRGTPYGFIFKKAFPLVQFLFEPRPALHAITFEEIREFLGDDKIDCLFIDGDKCAFDKDFYAYRPLLKKGSLVFLHDIWDDVPPARVFRELQQSYASSSIVDVTEGLEAARRAVLGEAISSSYEGWLRTWNTTSCGVGVIYL